MAKRSWAINLLETELFEPCINTICVRLIGTDFYFYKDKVLRKWIGETNTDSRKCKEVKLEDILEEIPEDIQTKILFHLDIIREYNVQKRT